MLVTAAGALLIGTDQNDPLAHLGRLYRSEDDGASWEVLDSWIGASVRALVQTPSGAWLGSVVEGKVAWYTYRSPDEGTTWQRVSHGAPRAFAVSPEEVLIGVGHEEGGVRSDDDGQTWDLIVLDNLNSALSTSQGVFVVAGLFQSYRSLDEGVTWEPLASPIAGAALAVDGEDYVYLGGEGGVYRSAEPVILGTQTEEVTIPRLSLRAYPNPARERLTVVYQVPERTALQLTVYDVMGREVAHLAEEEVVRGEHTLVWEAGDLAAGVYLLYLQAGSQERRQRVVMLR